MSSSLHNPDPSAPIPRANTAPSINFNPPASKLTDLIRDLASENLSLVDIAHYNDTTIEALTLWMARLEIQAQLFAIQTAAAFKSRIAATVLLARAVNAIDTILTNASRDSAEPGTPSHNATLRANRDARRAAWLLHRIANFFPHSPGSKGGAGESPHWAVGASGPIRPSLNASSSSSYLAPATSSSGAGVPPVPTPTTNTSPGTTVRTPSTIETALAPDKGCSVLTKHLQSDAPTVQPPLPQPQGMNVHTRALSALTSETHGHGVTCPAPQRGAGDAANTAHSSVSVPQSSQAAPLQTPCPDLAPPSGAELRRSKSETG